MLKTMLKMLKSCENSPNFPLNIGKTGLKEDFIVEKTQDIV